MFVNYKDYKIGLKEDFGIEVPVSMPMYMCMELYNKCLENGSDDVSIQTAIEEFKRNFPWHNTTNKEIENSPAYLRNKNRKGK